eukprot:2382560-Amphidinium_carterae.1
MVHVELLQDLMKELEKEEACPSCSVRYRPGWFHPLWRLTSLLVWAPAAAVRAFWIVGCRLSKWGMSGIPRALGQA